MQENAVTHRPKSMDQQLIEAIDSGDLDTVTSILNSPTFNKEESNLNAHLSTAILQIQNEHAREIVALLLEHGADVNHLYRYKRFYQISPLQLAVLNAEEHHWNRYGTIFRSHFISSGGTTTKFPSPHRYPCLQMVALLLAYGANDKNLLSPYSHSSYSQMHYEMDTRAPYESEPGHPLTKGHKRVIASELSLAVRYADLDTVKSLLPLVKKSGTLDSLLRAAVNSSYSPAHEKHFQSQIMKIIKLLLEHGASPHIVDNPQVCERIGTTTLEAFQLTSRKAYYLDRCFTTASTELQNNPVNVLPYSIEALRNHFNSLAKSLSKKLWLSHKDKNAKAEVHAALKKLDEISADGNNPLKITALALAIQRAFPDLMSTTFETLHLNHHFMPACDELQNNPESLLPCSVAQALRDQLDALNALSESFPDKYKKAEVTAALEKLNKVSAQNDSLKITALALAIQRAFPDLGINLVISRKQREEQLRDPDAEPDGASAAAEVELAELGRAREVPVVESKDDDRRPPLVVKVVKERSPQQEGYLDDVLDDKGLTASKKEKTPSPSSFWSSSRLDKKPTATPETNSNSRSLTR